MSEIVFLSVEQVCGIQKSTLPGAPASNIGLIEGAVNRVINHYFYNGSSNVFELAALYLIAISKAHAFPDANKRTAFQSALTFLQCNNVFLPESQEIEEITIKAAQGKASINEIAQIFYENYINSLNTL